VLCSKPRTYSFLPHDDTLIASHEAMQPPSDVRLRLERDHTRAERREGHRPVTEVGADIEYEVAVAHEGGVQAS
jgi:hypothetical protein